jgi:hypothetical protein
MSSLRYGCEGERSAMFVEVSMVEMEKLARGVYYTVLIFGVPYAIYLMLTNRCSKCKKVIWSFRVKKVITIESGAYGEKVTEYTLHPYCEME